MTLSIGLLPLPRISPIKALKMPTTTGITVTSLAESEKKQETRQRLISLSLIQPLQKNLAVKLGLHSSRRYTRWTHSYVAKI
jgi:hypothetical protein